MDKNSIYKEIVTIGQNVLNLANSAKDKTIESDKLAKLMTSAILLNDIETSEKLNSLFVKDAVFHSLRKIKTMASLTANVLAVQGKIVYSVKGKESLSITLEDVKENKWNDNVKVSSVYASLKEAKTGVTVSDKEAFATWCQHNRGNMVASLSLEDAKAFLPEETLQTMLQEGRAMKEQTINEIQAQKAVIDMFEQFKALPPQEAHSFLIQAQAFLDTQEIKEAA